MVIIWIIVLVIGFKIYNTHLKPQIRANKRFNHKRYNNVSLSSIKAVDEEIAMLEAIRDGMVNSLVEEIGFD